MLTDHESRPKATTTATSAQMKAKVPMRATGKTEPQTWTKCSKRIELNNKQAEILF